MRRLLSLAYEQGVPPSMPKVKLFKTEKTTFDFLDFKETDRLLAAADPEWRTLLLVAVRTGLPFVPPPRIDGRPIRVAGLAGG